MRCLAKKKRWACFFLFATFYSKVRREKKEWLLGCFCAHSNKAVNYFFVFFCIYPDKFLLLFWLLLLLLLSPTLFRLHSHTFNTAFCFLERKYVDLNLCCSFSCFRLFVVNTKEKRTNANTTTTTKRNNSTKRKKEEKNRRWIKLAKNQNNIISIIDFQLNCCFCCCWCQHRRRSFFMQFLFFFLFLVFSCIYSNSQKRWWGCTWYLGDE